MKLIAIGAAFFLFLNVASAEGPRQITVTGEAKVLTAPDEAVINFGIETWDRNLAKAKKDNDTIVKKAIDIANEFKIDKKFQQTDQLSVEMDRKGWNERSAFGVEGYFVRRNVGLTLRDLTKFDDLLSRVLDVGVNYLHAVDFRSTDLRKHRELALELAIKAAHDKAVGIAKATGQKIGRPISIQELTDQWGSRYNNFWNGRFGPLGNQTGIQESKSTIPVSGEASAPGQITVHASVSATYQLVE